MFLKQLSIAAVDCLRCLPFVQLQKMERPTVWNNERSTFYKSWSTTLYYKNEAYVCGFVGMEVNKEKAFEVLHRRPDLDLAVTNNVSRPEKVATKSPTMKMHKKPAMIMIPKTAVKKGVDKPQKTVKKAAVQTAIIMKKAMKRSS